MECTIKGIPGEDWSCQVSLRFEYDDRAGTELQTPDIVKFGPMLYEPSEVEIMLRRAQTAILNPNSVAESFLNLTQEQLSAFHPGSHSPDSLKFSRNVISMEITTSDSASLAFVDLPGQLNFSLPFRVILFLVRFDCQRGRRDSEIRRKPSEE